MQIEALQWDQTWLSDVFKSITITSHAITDFPGISADTPRQCTNSFTLAICVGNLHSDLAQEVDIAQKKIG